MTGLIGSKVVGLLRGKGHDVLAASPNTGELAGPERIPLDALVRSHLEATGDRRQVIADIRARYFGTKLDDRSPTPGAHPMLGASRFEDWLLRPSHLA